MCRVDVKTIRQRKQYGSQAGDGRLKEGHHDLGIVSEGKSGSKYRGCVEAGH